MLAQILLLILGTATQLLSAVLLARFALQVVRAPFRNPLGQFLLAATNWMVLPARRLIPSIAGYDSASLILAWLWQVLFYRLAIGLGGALGGLALGPLVGILLVAVLETAKVAIYLTMGIVLVSAVFSWVNPHAPMAASVNALANPLLRPLRRVIPPLGGVDLSPLALLLALEILRIVLDHLRSGLMPLFMMA